MRCYQLCPSFPADFGPRVGPHPPRRCWSLRIFPQYASRCPDSKTKAFVCTVMETDKLRRILLAPQYRPLCDMVQSVCPHLKAFGLGDPLEER